MKNFKPYYFITPNHIFNETHFSKSFQSGARNSNLNEFERSHANNLDYHVLGLKCLMSSDQMPYSEIHTFKNPFVLEYISSQRLYLKSKLFDPDGIKLKNMTLIQSDFSSKQQEFKYCVIADLPEKDTMYQLVLYGVNKEPGPGITYPELTKYSVVLAGDEINEEIPQYNLSFDYHIKLKSHYSQLIKFDTNPVIMEFVVPNTTQALFKVTQRDETPVENAVIAQKTLESSSMLVNVALPKLNETYFLKLYAKRAKDTASKNFNYVSQIQLVRTHSDENDELKFCTIFITDLKVIKIYFFNSCSFCEYE